MSPTVNGLATSTQRQIDAFLDEQIVKQNAPGASIAVFVDIEDGIVRRAQLWSPSPPGRRTPSFRARRI